MGAELGFIPSNLSLQLLFVQLSQDLALLYSIASINQQFLHNAAGFRLHLDLGNRQHLASCDYTLGQIAFFNRRDLCRINLGAAAGRLGDHSPDHEQNNHSCRDPPNAPFLLLIIRIAVSHVFPPPHRSWLHTRVISHEFLNIFL